MCEVTRPGPQEEWGKSTNLFIFFSVTNLEWIIVFGLDSSPLASADLSALAGPALFRGRLRAFGKCPNDVSLLEVLPRKVAVHTSSQLMPIEAGQSAVSTTWEGRRVSSDVRLKHCTQVWGFAKFGQRATHGWGKIVLHTCSHLSEPVRTCPNLSTIQWPCTLVAQCHFLLFRMLLFFGLTS